MLVYSAKTHVICTTNPADEKAHQIVPGWSEIPDSVWPLFEVTKLVSNSIASGEIRVHASAKALADLGTEEASVILKDVVSPVVLDDWKSAELSKKHSQQRLNFVTAIDHRRAEIIKAAKGE